MIYFSFLSTSFGEYLFVEGNSSGSIIWSKFSNDKKLNLKNLFQNLAKSKTGRSLIRLANEKGKESGLSLYELVEEGQGSLTDTTLVRKFNRVHFDKISYETNSKIFINRNLTQHDAILDLAHELTHFVYRTQFNPYLKNFSLSQFIKSTIEGEGGEVQAFMMECRVQKELYKKKDDSRYNCRQITHPDTGELSFSLARKRFYQVGNYFESFQSLLHKHKLTKVFPDLSAQKESFISSAYGIPYPVAAFEEYVSVLNRACENDRRRISLFKEEDGRAPASLSVLEESYKVRCSDFVN